MLKKIYKGIIEFYYDLMCLNYNYYHFVDENGIIRVGRYPKGLTCVISYEEVKKMKQFKIEVPEGYEIDKEQSDLSEGVVKFKKVDELPSSVDDVDWSVYCPCESDFTKKYKYKLEDLDTLLILRDIYNGYWKPDWHDNDNTSFSIVYDQYKVVGSFSFTSNNVLHFKTMELRDKFLENFRDLIEECKELI